MIARWQVALIWLALSTIVGIVTWALAGSFLVGFLLTPVAIWINGRIAERVDDW